MAKQLRSTFLMCQMLIDGLMNVFVDISVLTELNLYRWFDFILHIEVKCCCLSIPSIKHWFDIVSKLLLVDLPGAILILLDMLLSYYHTNTCKSTKTTCMYIRKSENYGLLGC